VRGRVTNLRFLDQLITHSRFAHGDKPRASNRRNAGAVPLAAQARSRHASSSFDPTSLHHRQRHDETLGRARPLAARRRQLPPDAPFAAAPAPAEVRMSWGSGLCSLDLAEQRRAAPRHHHARCAPFRCWRRASHLDMTAIAPPTTRACCRICSRWSAGRGHFRRGESFLREDPWQRLALVARAALPNLLLAYASALRQCGLCELSRHVVRCFVAVRSPSRPSTCFRIFDSSTGSRHARGDRCGAAAGKLWARVDLRHRNLSDRTSSRHARLLPAAGGASLKPPAPMCRHQGHAGCAAARAYTLVKAPEGRGRSVPVHFHLADTSGNRRRQRTGAIYRGRRRRRRVDRRRERIASQPNLGSLVESLRHGAARPGVDPQRLRMISSYWEQVLRVRAFESTSAPAPPRCTCHGMPWRSIPNLCRRARSVSTRRAGREWGGGVRGRQRHLETRESPPTSRRSRHLRCSW